MEDKNRELLSRVIEERLERVLKSDAESDNAKSDFKEAMEAVDRQIELTKLDASHEEQLKKQELEKEKQVREEELRMKEAKKDRWIRVAEIAAVSIVSPIIGYYTKRSFAKLICAYEKTDSFTMTAGKSGISSFFRFKD